MEATGMREPDARIKQVSRSLSFEGSELSRRTRSKSPVRKRSTASFSVNAETTIYPADCKSEFRVPSNDESNPTERTRANDIGNPWLSAKPFV
jgi:hypothetical protein